MQIAALRTFVMVAAAGGFHAASNRLSVSQATVSARIKVLEDQLGARLLERGRRGAGLTDAGRSFLPFAERIVRSWEQAVGAVGDRGAARRTLNIGTQLSVWSLLLIEWAYWIEENMPDVVQALEFDYFADMTAAVAQGTLDVVITDIGRGDASLTATPVFNERMVLVSSQPGRAGDADLPGLIGLDWGRDFNVQFAQAGLNLPPRKIAFGSGEFALRYMMVSGGTGYFPLRQVVRPLRRGRLFRVEGAPEITIPTYALYRRDAQNRALIEQAIEGFLL